jgi:hypothetical protein
MQDTKRKIPWVYIEEESAGSHPSACQKNRGLGQSFPLWFSVEINPASNWILERVRGLSQMS